MTRGVWFVAGVGAGVYAITRARRVAEAFTTEGLRDRLHALDVGVRMFRDEVAAGRVESEPALRRRLGLAHHDTGAGPRPDDHPALAGSRPATDGHDEEGTP